VTLHLQERVDWYCKKEREKTKQVGSMKGAGKLAKQTNLATLRAASGEGICTHPKRRGDIAGVATFPLTDPRKLCCRRRSFLRSNLTSTTGCSQQTPTHELLQIAQNRIIPYLIIWSAQGSLVVPRRLRDPRRPQHPCHCGTAHDVRRLLLHFCRGFVQRPFFNNAVTFEGPRAAPISAVALLLGKAASAQRVGQEGQMGCG
jgi:hypothetical protein